MLCITIQNKTLYDISITIGRRNDRRDNLRVTLAKLEEIAEKSDNVANIKWSDQEEKPY